jgi:hypothetical protein
MYYFSGKCFLKFVLINKWLLIIIGQIQPRELAALYVKKFVISLS